MSESISIPKEETKPRDIKIDLLGVTFANGAITLLNAVIGVMAARYLSVDNYGRLLYFITIFGVLRLLAAFGMSSQITYELASCRHRSELTESRFYPMLVVRLTSLVGMVAMIVGIGFGLRNSLLVLAAVAAGLALLTDFGVGALQGLAMIPQVVSVQVLQPVLYSLSVIFVLTFNFPVTSFYWSLILSFGFTLLLTGFWLSRILNFVVPRSTWVNGIRLSLRFAGGMYLLAILGSLFTSYATLFLGATERFTEAALVAIPLNLIVTFAVLVQTTVTTVYFPKLRGLEVSKRGSEAVSYFHLFFNLVSAATIFITALLMVYPHAMLGLLYGDRYLASSSLLPILAPITFLFVHQIVLTFSIVAQGRIQDSLPGVIVTTTFLVAMLTIIASLPNTLTLFALSQTISACIGFVWQLRIVNYPIKQPLINAIKFGVVAFTLFGLARLFVPDSPHRILAVILLFSIISIIYMAYVWFQGEVRQM